VFIAVINAKLMTTLSTFAVYDILDLALPLIGLTIYYYYYINNFGNLLL